MDEGTKGTCSMCSAPLTDENSCSCDPTKCCNCCTCAPDCTCGCQQKKGKTEEA